MATPEFIGSVVTVIVFYIIIAAVGVAASICFKKKYGQESNKIEFQIVAGRKLGSFVGWLTMTATLVGGGFLSGTAELVAAAGLVWNQPSFGICFGLIIGGLVYAPIMRRNNYYTMFDPMEEKYGTFVTALIYLSSLFGDILWSASILAALGTSIYVIAGVNITLAVIVSASVAVLYTLIGQMVSVAFTDVVELFFLALGLGIVTPFVMTNEAVAPRLAESVTGNFSIAWLGSIEPHRAALWADLAIAMTLGTIPWQSYFQRVLSVTSVSDARKLSILAGLSAIVLSLPSICIGVVSSVVDWKSTGLNESVYTDASLTLPLVIKEFSPPAVSIVGLAAIAAAVMSSADSAILGSSSAFTHNFYRKLRPHASALELGIVLKVCIVVVGIVSTIVALVSPSITIAGLFIMAADIVFVAVLPQLTCALFIPLCNGYGALVGYAASLVLRLTAGDGLIGLPATIKYPGYHVEADEQLFPFRTFAMLCSVLVSVCVSALARRILLRLPHNYDILRCVNQFWVYRRQARQSKDSQCEVPQEETTPNEGKSIPFQEF